MRRKTTFVLLILKSGTFLFVCSPVGARIVKNENIHCWSECTDSRTYSGKSKVRKNKANAFKRRGGGDCPYCGLGFGRNKIMFHQCCQIAFEIIFRCDTLFLC